jgi:hypothetical protein
MVGNVILLIGTIIMKKEYDWWLKPISPESKAIREQGKKIDAYRAGIRNEKRKSTPIRKSSAK